MATQQILGKSVDIIPRSSVNFGVTASARDPFQSLERPFHEPDHFRFVDQSSRAEMCDQVGRDH